MFLLCAFDLAVLYVVSTVAQVGLGGGTEGILTSLGACLLDLIPLAVLVLFFCLINQLVRGSSLTVLLCVVLYIGLLVMGTYLPAVGGLVFTGYLRWHNLGLGLPCPSFRCCPALAFWRGTAWSLDAAAISSLTGRKPDGKMAGRNPKGGGRHAEKNHPEGTVPADQSGDAGALPADRRGGHGGGDDFFTVRVPDGEKFLMESLSFLFGKQTIGPSRMVPVFVLAGVLLCLMVTGVCILLTSRLAGRITATLKTLRQAADNLRDGELDFQILSCDERDLDELSHSLESVRQRLKATAVAEAAAQEERGLLMANLSHDLRTPITAIKGYVEGIQDSIANTPEKQRHYLEIVYNKSVILERLVRNMSDFSEYELGRMQYHFEYVEMGPFLRDLAEEYQVDVQQNGMTFTAQIPQGHYVVTADRSKLKRVLDNLVSNAIKYGRAGGAIALTAEEYERGLVIQVSDNGKGISAQALRHVFDSFFREDSARTSSVPGSGLGLAICRSIVDSHHGKIWLTSEEGEGTRAFLYLPLQKEEGLL